MQHNLEHLPKTVAALHLSFDEDGFLIDPGHWNEDLAEQLAAAADVTPLTPVHWETIRYIRDKYLSVGALPPMRHVCRQLGLLRGEVKAMFGGCQQLWRIAGLPNPGEEAKAYMD